MQCPVKHSEIEFSKVLYFTREPVIVGLLLVSQLVTACCNCMILHFFTNYTDLLYQTLVYMCV